MWSAWYNLLNELQIDETTQQQKQTVKLKGSKCWKLVNLQDSEARGFRIFPTFLAVFQWPAYSDDIFLKKLIWIAYFCFYFFFLSFTSLHNN